MMPDTCFEAGRTAHTALWVPAPAKWINSNQRLHRMQVAKLTAQWRETAATRASGIAPMRRAHIIAYVWKPRRGRYDPGNLYPTAKACVDGMVDSGVLPDDDWEHLDGPDLRHGGTGPAGLSLAIHEIFPTQ